MFLLAFLLLFPSAQHFRVTYRGVRIGSATLTNTTLSPRHEQLKFTLDGSFLWLSVHDTITSTYDQDYTTSSFSQNLHEKSSRAHRYIFGPDSYTDTAKPDTPHASPIGHMDDLSALAWALAQPLVPGDTITLGRYFKPEHNPIAFAVYSDTLDGQPAILLVPSLKTGLLANGKSKLWLDPQTHVLRRLTLSIPIGTLILSPD